MSVTVTPKRCDFTIEGKDVAHVAPGLCARCGAELKGQRVFRGKFETAYEVTLWDVCLPCRDVIASDKAAFCLFGMDVTERMALFHSQPGATA
jgi:hypothetical protein